MTHNTMPPMHTKLFAAGQARAVRMQALLKMAELPYSGVTSFFMKTLLDKKYSLPYRVVDALVDHYASFRVEERAMPVIWHLSLCAALQARDPHRGTCRARAPPLSCCHLSALVRLRRLAAASAPW
jgi:hypothetical protein